MKQNFEIANRLDTPPILKQMQLDVIFLDIDGVLNPDQNTDKHVFAPGCVAQLRRILDARPAAHVVFSTTWRVGLAFFALGWIWRQHELPLSRVIGRTPDLHATLRGKEIQDWLDDAPRLAPKHKIRRYAVVDDEPEPILDVIPRQHVFTCDPAHGLTEAVADRVIRHLGSDKTL
jgi:hypothetical protein